MPLLYASLSRPKAADRKWQPGTSQTACVTHHNGGEVLAEHCTVQGDFSEAGKLCMRQMDFCRKGPVTFAVQDYRATYEYRDGLIYGVIATDDVTRSLCSAVLNRLGMELLKAEQRPQILQSATAGKLQKSLGPRLERTIELANSNPGDFDKMQKVQANVEEVNGIVANNIEMALQRGEDLESLEHKTATLEVSAAQFQLRGKILRKKLWWQDKKAKIFFGVAIAVVLLVLVLFILAHFGVLQPQGQ